MTITYHSGKRLQGIESDRTITTSFDGAGGTESTNGAKSVFTFTSDGNFVLTGSGDVEYLIVAGGGSGGVWVGGGGGSGGVRTGTFTNLTAGTYSVVVGSGGAGQSGGAGAKQGISGTNSSINSISATGGGGGGASTYSALSGGSGGGGREGGVAGGSGNAGGYTPVEGYAGGSGGSSDTGGGGGGSGAVGQSAPNSSTGGDGGNGIQSSIFNGNATYYAGGGGGNTSGGTGGLGGGGNGSTSNNGNASNATGYGSGGGGSRNSGNGGGNSGSGSDGIVILSLTSSSTTTYPLNSNTSPAGSRFEETDTRKFYTKDVNGWQEKGNELGYRHASTYAQNQPAEANPFTTINKQHFVEWFSGKQLPSYWDGSTGYSGGAGGAMLDEVDGGFKMSTVSAQWARQTWWFGGKNQYSAGGSELISVFKFDNNENVSLVGFSDETDLAGSATAHIATAECRKSANSYGQTYFTLYTNDGSNNSRLPSTVTLDTNWHTFKVTNTSGANTLLSIDGVLEVTKSTNKPTDPMCPAFIVDAQTAHVATAQIRYLEAYNT